MTNEGEQSKRERTVGIALLVALVVAYGVPLALGWAHANRIKSDPTEMRAFLEQRIVSERGSFVVCDFLRTIARKFPDRETRDMLLNYSSDPRPFVRYTAVDLLWKDYRDDDGAMTAVRDYMTNPREVAHFRLQFFLNNPEVETADFGAQARALLKFQADFFPKEGYFFAAP